MKKSRFSFNNRKPALSVVIFSFLVSVNWQLLLWDESYVLRFSFNFFYQVRCIVERCCCSASWYFRSTFCIPMIISHEICPDLCYFIICSLVWQHTLGLLHITSLDIGCWYVRLNIDTSKKMVIRLSSISFQGSDYMLLD